MNPVVVAHLLLFVTTVALAAVIVLIDFLYRWWRSPRCPACGGYLEEDAEKYRSTIEYACTACGRTYEKLRRLAE